MEEDEGSIILIVDDNEDFRTMLKTTLEMRDYSVMEASDGNDGLYRLDKLSFDLIITDLLMPGMGGYDFIKEIRKTNPTIRIIAISGGSKHANQELCLAMAEKYAIDGVLGKPFSSEELFALIDKVME